MKELTKILFADDEPELATITLFSLEKIGKFTALGCQNGQELLDRAEAFAPDLILLDVVMPGVDGPETLKRLKAMPALEGVPVLFMTAKSQPAEIAYLKGIGAHDVIMKPFDPMTLSDHLRTIWKGIPDVR